MKKAKEITTITEVFEKNTFDKKSAHICVEGNFPIESIKEEYLIIASFVEKEDYFDGIVIKKEVLRNIKEKKSFSLHIKIAKEDVDSVAKNAYKWQFEYGIGALIITTI